MRTGTASCTATSNGEHPPRRRHAVVADFGIAAPFAVPARRRGPGHGGPTEATRTLTAAGMALGTPA
jgi:hypothetical protein